MLHLPLLLINVSWLASFEFLRTVKGRVFNKQQAACRELQLLLKDNHWGLTLAKFVLTSTPNNVRQLFEIILPATFFHRKR